MKKSPILFTIILLLFNSCSLPEEDESYDKKVIQINLLDVINVAQQQNYSINELVNLSITIPRLVRENDYSELLDIRRTSPNGNFKFQIKYSKKNTSGNWEIIKFEPFLKFVNGGVISSNDEYSPTYGLAIFNETNQNYSFEAAIMLIQAGQYKLEISPLITTYYKEKQDLTFFEIYHNEQSTTKYSVEFSVN